MKELVGNFEVVCGDITKVETDIMVNAANGRLLGGGGVDGAIHKAAGEELAKCCREMYRKNVACDEIDVLGVSGVVDTPSFDLSPICDSIFHAVGPDTRIFTEEYAKKALKNTYINIMRLFFVKRDFDKQYATITLPAISCGVYGYPIKEAAVLAINIVLHWVEVYPITVKFVLFDKADADWYKYLINSII